MKPVHRLALGLAWVVGLAVLGGCSAYDIVLTPQPELRGANGNMRTAVIDVIGVSEAEVARWRGVPVTAYFSETGNSLRRDSAQSRFTTEFNAAKTQTVTLSKSDKIWNTWKSPAYLVIMANVPESPTKDMEGDKDPRRLVLAVKDLSWSTKELDIGVKGGSITVSEK